MMAMKKMQLMENYSSGAKPASAWATSKAASSEKKATSKPFQYILEEEQKRSPNHFAKAPRGKLSSPLMAKPRVTSRTLTAAAITHPMKSPSPVACTIKKFLPVTSPGSSLPLSAFMKKSEAPNSCDSMGSIGASWGATPTRKTILIGRLKQDADPPKSLSEIQQEEKSLIRKEDHMCRIDGNQWYVQQRERAASMGEIQEKEEKDRDMLELIEEQKQIEKEIMKRVKQDENVKKRGKKKHGRKKSTKSGIVK